jgi:cysteine synthase A
LALPDRRRKGIEVTRKPPPSVASTLEAIGMTPVVQLKKIVPADAGDVFVKLEYFNPTGSYKDRMALAMIEQAEARGDLHPGMTVVEYTGGSTGSSLAFVCAVKGYRFRVVSSDAFAKAKLDTMTAFGAELHIVRSKGGKVTPDLVPRMIEEASALAEQEGTYFTNQLHNSDTIEGYRKIGEELVDQLDRPIDVFCGGVGTAGMLMGVAQVVRQSNPRAKIVALEPSTSAVISGEEAGTHHVEGIGIGFIPPLLDQNLYDDVRAIDEDEARRTARSLAKEEGIFAGISSGLNVAAAILLAKEMGRGATIATVAVDTGLKYLGGDLYAD